MSGSVLDRFSPQRGRGIATPEPTLADLQEQEAAEDLGSFGWLRGAREAARMLELRKKDGTIRAVSYGLVEAVDFDPAEGITLTVLGKPIRIRGRNLNAEARPNLRLFQGIARHRVPWVQEADESTALAAGEDSVLITRVEW